MAEDIRDIPTYTITEAALYLRLPVYTLQNWIGGYSYKTSTGVRQSKPLIKPAGKEPRQLSFYNLIEAHVLSALRRKHRIPMRNVRKALDYLKREHKSKHPLADYWFETDGIHIFIDAAKKLEIISQDGQLAMEMLRRYLSRIERDDLDLAVRLYPYTASSIEGLRLVVIDPRVSFGRPVITGTGIPTSIIAERFKAGEGVDLLAGDYGRTSQEIEEALRCEYRPQAA